MKNLIVFALCFCFLGVIQAQSDYFLKIEGIEGESMDKDHKGWIDILSFTHSIHQPSAAATGSTRRRGAVIIEDLTCSKELDKSSPKIQEAVCKGKVFPKVEIQLTRAGRGNKEPYYTYELKNVLITSFSISGQSDSSLPMEEFAFSFEEIKVTYTTYDANGRKTGNVEYEWKVEKGSK
jgi:type VI secretion system secreted protein Hcp